jgi:N utilization substance protein A
MGGVVLNEQSLQLMAQFEELTGAGSRDCIVDDQNDRLIFVINPGDMGRAIGKKGATIKSVSETLGKRVEVVEYSSDPAQFLKNCFLPAKVLDVDIRDGEEEDDDQRVAYVDIPEEDRGLAIGKAGKNIIKAKQLAQRQHDIADVKLA